MSRVERQPIACPDCGEAREALGTHGGREHFRCRACGIRFMYAVKARPIALEPREIAAAVGES